MVHSDESGDARRSVARRFVPVGDTLLSLLAAGDEGRPVVVLLHGIPTGAELWRGVLPELAAAGWRALAPNLPGYGLTRPPEGGDRSLAGAAETLAAWIDRARMAPVWLVGHDLGGGVAQILAVRHPRLVGRLTLGDTVVGDSWPVPPIRLLRALARLRLYRPLAALGAPRHDPYLRHQLRRAFATRRPSDEERRRIFFDGKVGDPRGRREFEGHLRELDPRQTAAVEEELGGLEVPTQLVWGESDPFQPWETVGRRLAARLPAPAATVVPGAGHFPMLERPRGYVDALLGWAAEG